MLPIAQAHNVSVADGVAQDRLTNRGTASVTPGSGAARPPLATFASRSRILSWKEIAFAVAALFAATVISLALLPNVPATNLAMIYLLGVVAISTHCSRRISVASSFVSVAAFDFFCVPPYLTFRVSEYEYLITFAGVLAVALVVSTQTALIRMQAADALDREARTHALYSLSHTLGAESSIFEAARVAAQTAEDLFRVQVTIFLPERGEISFRRRTSDRLIVPRAEKPVAQWVLDHAQRAGKTTSVTPGATALYLPLQGTQGVVGVMAVLPDSDARFSPEQSSFLDAFANHTALALDRTQAQNAAEAHRVRRQAEELRSSLLSTVSHDLRTPLASITGAASTLRSQEDKLPAETRHELLDSISEEAERLGRLVRNLLDMTSLQSGFELRRELCPIEEIVGAALQRMEAQLKDRQVITSLADSLPPVPVDDVLFGQVIANVLENSLKYTPPGTEIEIAAEAGEDSITLEIRDRGPGLPEGDEHRIFEKFYRGKSEKVRGAGLGLAICRAIVEAHHGTIDAFNRTGGGAVFRIRLPLEGAR